MQKVIIYTDGACSPNPGVGGWGAVLISVNHDNARKEISGSSPKSTNNQMELMAVIKALESLKSPCDVALYTDSKYVRDAIEKGWLTKWQTNNWKTAAKKNVANQELWQLIADLIKTHKVKFNWVKAHNGHPENEVADQLAVNARLAIS